MEGEIDVLTNGALADANDGLSGISIEFDLPGIFGAQDDERTENREAADNDGEGGRRLYSS